MLCKMGCNHLVHLIRLQHKQGDQAFATDNSPSQRTPLPKDLELARKATVAWKRYMRYNTNRYLLQTQRLYEAAAKEARRIGDPIAQRHFQSQANRMFEFWRLKNNAFP